VLYFDILKIQYNRMEGYNPSASLLPQGSGVIHHMSGGNMPPGYDPSASLLPNVPATIGIYKGGNNAIVTNTDNPIPAISAIESKKDGNIASGTNTDSTIAAISAIESKKDGNIANGTNTDSIIAAISAIESKKDGNIPIDSTKDDERRIFLFKKTHIITNPMNTDIISEKNKKILVEFGLEKAENKIQLSILRAIWDIPSDIHCDTNASIATIGKCEPIRRLLNSLKAYSVQLLTQNMSKNMNINYKSLIEQLPSDILPSRPSLPVAVAPETAEAAEEKAAEVAEEVAEVAEVAEEAERDAALDAAGAAEREAALDTAVAAEAAEAKAVDAAIASVEAAIAASVAVEAEREAAEREAAETAEKKAAKQSKSSKSVAEGIHQIGSPDLANHARGAAMGSTITAVGSHWFIPYLVNIEKCPLTRWPCQQRNQFRHRPRSRRRIRQST